MPCAIKYGIDVDTFYKLNPKIMKVYQDVYMDKHKEELQEVEVTAYVNGVYQMKAIASVLSKNSQYPKKLLGILKTEDEEEEVELTEEEKKEQQELLLAKLQIMMGNFETSRINKDS